jgi:DNA-binding CsgD family transcriptional regulator
LFRPSSSPDIQEPAAFIDRYGLTEQELSASYAYCAEAGLARNRPAPENILPRPAVRQIKKIQRPYLRAALPVLLEAYKDLPAGFVCFLTDDRLINLYTIGSCEVRVQCCRMGLVPGTDFSEPSAGTNAISMCRKLQRTVILFGPQHYLRDLFGGIWCVAGEVHLPNGELLWIFDVSAPTERDLHLAVPVVNLVTKQLEQAAAGVWYLQQGSTALCEAALSLAVEPLTPREHEILALLFAGKSNTDIGRMLSISDGTVYTHVSQIYRKFAVGSWKGLSAKLWAKLQQMLSKDRR